MERSDPEMQGGIRHRAVCNSDLLPGTQVLLSCFETSECETLHLRKISQYVYEG